MVQCTDQHLDQYRTAGYCLVKDLIPPELISAARQRTMEIAANLAPWPAVHFQVLDPIRYSSKNNTPLPGGIQRPASQEEVFAKIADHPHLVEVMAMLLSNVVERFTDQLGVKHAIVSQEQGGRSYFHQDSYYWKIPPERGCNCWIPLTQVGMDASGLAMMPYSHAGWQLVEHESYYDDPPLGRLEEDDYQPFKRHRVVPSLVDHSKEKLIVTKPGDGLFFTNYTWHRSEPNCSGQDQAFYAIAYQWAEN